MARPFRLTAQVVPEQIEAEHFMRWVRAHMAAHPELKLLYHIPNGWRALFRIQTVEQLQRAGVLPGIPDYCLPVARGGFHALYIELKRADGGVVSDEQSIVQGWLVEYGNRAVTCSGWSAAVDAVLGYLAMAEMAAVRNCLAQESR